MRNDDIPFSHYQGMRSLDYNEEAPTPHDRQKQTTAFCSQLIFNSAFCQTVSSLEEKVTPNIDLLWKQHGFTRNKQRQGRQLQSQLIASSVTYKGCVACRLSNCTQRKRAEHHKKLSLQVDLFGSSSWFLMNGLSLQTNNVTKRISL